MCKAQKYTFKYYKRQIVFLIKSNKSFNYQQARNIKKVKEYAFTEALEANI